MKKSSRSAAPPGGGSADPIPTAKPIVKKRTGIPGFDEITEGGLPAVGVTAIVGDPGSGKTVFALQMLVNGFRRGEPGILVAFEEPTEQLRYNLSSFDWGFADIANDDICLIDARLPADTIQTGGFDLSGLLASLEGRIAESGATNLVFDGIDMLLGALNDEALERQEMARLGEWVRRSGVTAIITVKSYGASERDEQRTAVLQFLSDSVVRFQGSLTPDAFSRTVRIVKYRGSGFAANPVPFVIGESGIEVIGFGGIRLDYPIFSERVSTGVDRLDAKLGGGYVRASCTLVSGAPGTSKTSLGASFLNAACERGSRCLFVSFDESSSQIVSNMRSIGLDLARHVESGLLTMESFISASRSPEEHFVAIRKMIAGHRPEFMVIDPLSALLKMQLPFAEMIGERILEHAKLAGITVLCTSLLDSVTGTQELSASHVSTLADTWLHVSYVASEGERNRALTIIKSRGTAHSNQVSEMVLGPGGIDIVDVYTAEGEVLMGSARHQKQASDRRKELQMEIAGQRARFELDKDVADLKSVLQRAVQNLEWKEREVALLGLEEKALREGARTDADERLILRQD
ncbi:circadian clock protein KaiC [Mesorhizobium sp. ES1-1]|uniref:circadian clock protein KaiC n=1 Tax=Mesorhizobium sp. ES1-1 TaxID=2876629 RepID=UPI001CD007D4|nr:circadian clock protein KaiC [Mesorhizobium sp. ES1-1]MBZ9675185.1 circadian clock protein KaiC [Mesorhizobium sp. ES1-1]